MAQELNRVWGMVCEKDRYYYNEKNVDAVLAEKDEEIRRLKRALWRAPAVSTSSRIARKRKTTRRA